MNWIKEKLIYLGYVLFVLYAIGVMFYGALFEWAYAREHGFLNWLLLGWFIPSLKAIIWPLYAFF